MGAYLAYRIIQGIYTYDYVTSKRIDLKEAVDAYLTEQEKADLITTP